MRQAHAAALTKAEILKEIKMHPRELRVLTKFTKNVASLLVKDNAIVVNMLVRDPATYGAEHQGRHPVQQGDGLRPPGQSGVP